MIPQCDPRASYLSNRKAVDAAIQRVLDSGTYLRGREVAAFEVAFARWVGADAGIAVANGTDAIELALRAIGVGVGDLVFTVSHTAVATIAAIERAGAVPVFVDIDPHTYTMDPHHLSESIVAVKRDRSVFRGEPRAIVPVHLYGHPAAIESICAIAKEHGLQVVEDCAQAHGAKVDGRMVGTFGDASAFSFYPTKNLGAFGDAGMVVTSNAELADRVHLLREYGWRTLQTSDIPGVNSRMDEMQAAILSAKLGNLDHALTQRREAAALYAALLPRSIVVLPSTKPMCTHAFHQYVVRTPFRDSLKLFLSEQGIATGVHYPCPVHLQPAYCGRIKSVKPLCETEAAAHQVLSLPMYPELSESVLRRVCCVMGVWSSAGQ